jgi:hypothetical protein
VVILAYTFKGGIHVEEYKLTAKNRTQIIPDPPMVRISMNQSIGAPASPTVKVGDLVRVGTKIGEADGYISSPVFSLLDNISSPVNYEEVLPIIVDKTICAHRINSKIHEALHSMTHTDEEVAKRFGDLEDKLTLNIEDKLRSLGENLESMKEKIHLAICIIQAFSHETIYDEHSYIDYPKMEKIVLKTLIDLFK